MRISAAELADAQAIASIQVRSWRAGYRDFLAPAYLAAMSEAARGDRWREILAAPASTTLVARQGDEVIGFVSHGPCRDAEAPEDQGEIWALYVDPPSWGKGTGRALLGEALEALHMGGRQAVSLWVFRENRGGRAFYETCGFMRVPGRVKHLDLGGELVEAVAYLRR